MKTLRVAAPAMGGFTATDRGFSYGRTTPAEKKPAQRTAHLLGAPFLATVDASSGAVTVRSEEAPAEVSLIPRRLPFHVDKGVARDGHVFFTAGDDAVIQTPIDHGVKEDILLARPRGDVFDAEWQLELGATLQAVLEADGSIGIAPPHAKQALYRLPAPVVRDADGDAAVQARWWLDGARVTLHVEGLAALRYPVDVDPAVLVLTTSKDLGLGGNLEADVDLDVANGRVVRGRLGSPGTGATNFLSTLAQARQDHASVGYNGFVYVVGGEYGTPLTTSQVEYAPVTNPSTGALGAWVQQSGLFPARSGLGAVAYNGFMYVVGGSNGTTFYNDVRYARINADGSLGAFTATTSFTTGRRYPNVVAANGWLYVICGNDSNGTELNDVQYAPINGDGTLGPFTTGPNPFAFGRTQAGAAAWGGFVYVVGGSFGASYLTDVQVAAINADGSLGNASAPAFTNLGASALPAVRYNFGTVAYGGALWVTGGFDAATGTWSAQALVGTIKPNGTLAPWQTAGVVGTRRYHHATTALGGYLYTSGGHAESGANPAVDLSIVADVWSAKVKTTSTDASSTTLSSTGPYQAWGTAAAVWNGYLYVLGGSSSQISAFTQNWVSNLAYAPLNADGTVTNGTWVTVAGGGFGRQTRLVTYNGYLFVVGGSMTNTNMTTVYGDVWSAPLGANGAPGAFTQSPSSLPSPRTTAGVLVSNGRLYVIGGYDGSAAQPDIWVAQLTTTGGVGPFQALPVGSPSSLLAPRSNLGAVAYAGTMYVWGGAGSIEFAPISYATGAVGSFASLGSGDNNAVYGYAGMDGALYGVIYSGVDWFNLGQTAIPGALNGTFLNLVTNEGVAAFNGRLELVNGADYSAPGSPHQQLITVAASGAGGLGTFGSAGQTLGTREKHCTVAYNGFVYAIGGLPAPGGAPLGDIVYAAVKPNGTLGTPVTQSSPGYAPRSAMGCATANGVLYIAGGVGASGLLSDVSWAPLNADGSVGTFTSGGSLPTARSDFGFAASHNTLYVVGGNNGSGVDGVVYTALLGAGGAPGAFSASANSIPPRSGLLLVANDQTLYAVGGYDGAGYLADVEMSALSVTGAPGAWAVTSGLPGTRAGLAGAVYGGRLYVSGGYNAQGSYGRDVWYGGLLSKGGVTTWTPAPSMATGRQLHGMAATGGALFVVGGETSVSTATGNVDASLISGSPPVGTYTRSLDLLLVANTLDSVTVSGTAGLGGQVSLQYRVAGANAVYGPWQNKGPIALGTPVPLGDASVRYVMLKLTLDDSASANVDFDAARERDVTDISVTYSPPPPNKVVFTSAPQSAVTAGSCAALTVTSEVTTGGVSPVTTDTAVTFSGAGVTFYSDSGCTMAGAMQTMPVGTSTLTVYFSSTTAGPVTITDTPNGGLSGDAQSETIVPAAATKLAFIANAIGPYTANVSFAPALKVAAQDMYGNTVTSYSTAVTLALSPNGAGATLNSGTGAGPIAGVATFSNVTCTTAGTGFTLTATSGSLAAATSAPFNINGGNPNSILWTVQPGTSTAGQPIAGPPTITLKDQWGNLCNAATNTITLSHYAGPGGALTGTTSLQQTGGVATFDSVSLATPGNNHQLGVTVSGVGGPFPSNAFTVVAGPPAKLQFASSPGTTTAGASLNIVVQLTDSVGNPTPGTNPITIAIGNNPGTGTLLGMPTTVSATAGSATFSGLGIDKAGTGYTLTASSPGLTGATSAAFNITAGATTAIGFGVQPTTTAATAVITPAVKVQTQDSYGNATTSQGNQVTLSLLNNPGGSTLSGTLTANTDFTGAAAFSNLSLNKVGTGYTLKATTSFLGNATSAPFDITVGAPTALKFVQQPTTTPAGSVINPAVTVAIVDPGGNPVMSASANVTMSVQLSQVPLSGTLTQPTVSGVATFPDLSTTKSGSAILVANATGLAAASSNVWTVTALAPVSLYFSTQPPVNVTAGQNFGFSVGTKDMYGNNATLSGYSIDAGLLNNPTGATLTGTLGTVNGVPFSMTGNLTAAGTGYSLQASSTPALPPVASTSFNVAPAAPSGVAFATQPSDVIAGAAIAPPVRVMIVDAFGNLEDGGTQVVALTIAVNPDGGTLSGTNPVNAVQGVATFPNLSINKAGTGYKLTATADGGAFPPVNLTGATSVAFNVSGGAPTALYFPASDPSSIGAATCSPAVVVGLKDSQGNTTNAATNVTVNLSAPGLQLFADSNCMTPASSVGIPAGQASGTFYFSGSTMGSSYVITASGMSLAQATLPEQIVVSNASKLVITSAAVTANAGACSAAVTVAAQDNGGNPSGVPVDTTLTLSTSNGMNVSFFSDMSCTAATFLMPSGTTTLPVYFKSNKAQTFTLTATATSGATLAPGSQLGETVRPGAGAQLAFVGTAPTLVAGTCSGSRTVTLTDALGNTVQAPSAVTLNLSSSPGATFYSDSSCMTVATSVPLPMGMSQATLSYKHTVAGTPTITAADAVNNFTAATELPTITPAAATKLQFGVQPATSTAGATVVGPVRVDVADTYGNRVTTSTAPVTLALATNAGSVTLMGTTSVNAVNGSSLFDMVHVDTAGTAYVLQATSGGLTSGSSMPFDVLPASAMGLVFQQQPANAIAGNPLNPAPKVAVVDNFGNVVPTATGNASLALAMNAGNVMLNGVATVSLVQGVATFPAVHVDTTGTGYALVATSNALMRNSSTFDITPGAPVKTHFVVQPSNAIAGTAIAPAVQVGIADTFGNVVPTVTGSVTLGLDPTSTPGGALGGTTQQPTDGGIATFANVSIDKQGTYKLVATSGTLTPDTSNSFFVNNSGIATQLVFSSAPVTVAAGACSSSKLTVNTMDDGNNLTPVAMDTSVSLTGPAGVGFFTDANCTTSASAVTMGAGTSAVSFYFRAMSAGDTTLTATATGLRPGSQVETVTGIAAPVIDQKDITVQVGGTQRFTATGGTPPYHWSLMQPSASGGSIDDQGNYTAGQTAGVDDIVELEDSEHRHAQPVAVHVIPPPDAGTPLNQRPPVNGWSCGCQASGPVQLLGLVALVVLGRRRRARGSAVALLVMTVSALAFAAPKPKIAVLPLKVNADRDVEKLQKAFAAAATKLAIEQPAAADLDAALKAQGGGCDDRTDCLASVCKATGSAYALSVSIAPDEPSIQMTAKVVRYDGKVMRELGEFEVDKPKNLPRVAAAKKAFDKLFAQLKLDALKAVSVPATPPRAPEAPTPPIAEAPPPKAPEVPAAPALKVEPAPASAPAPARKGKASIAVLDVEQTVAGEKLDGSAFTEILTTAVDGTGLFKVLSSKDIVAMIGIERQRQLLGCNEESSCMAELTDALGADFLMMASVGKVGDSYLVTARLIESRTRQVSRASLQVKTPNLLLDAMWKVAQQALDSYSHTLTGDEAERWSHRPRVEPPAALAAVEPGPAISFSFGVDALALGGLQPLSTPGHRGSIGAQVDLLFRISRFDIELGGVVSPTPGARLMLGYAVLAKSFRLDVGLRGALFPTAGLYGGGAGVRAELGFGSVFAIVGNGGVEVYPGQGGVVLALLGAVGVGAHF